MKRVLAPFFPICYLDEDGFGAYPHVTLTEGAGLRSLHLFLHLILHLGGRYVHAKLFHICVC